MTNHAKALLLCLFIFGIDQTSHAGMCGTVFTPRKGKINYNRALDLAYLHFLNRSILEGPDPVPQLMSKLENEMDAFLDLLVTLKAEVAETKDVNRDSQFDAQWDTLTKYFHLLRTIDLKGEATELADRYLRILDYELSTAWLPMDVAKKINARAKTDEVRVILHTYILDASFR